ncbi:MAG: FMN-binding negative transcriptional regulator [Rhodospirillales bacterium]
MYVPRHFDMSAMEDIERRIAEDAFALLVSTIDGVPFATHLPLVARHAEDGGLVLAGHVARANPHWKHFDGVSEALAVFSGPHAYVSPRWYVTPGMVPTWNYEAVHVYGTLHAIEDADGTKAVLDQLTSMFEAAAAEPWSTARMEAASLTAMMRGIVAFEMRVTRIEGKSKMSQNRTAGDAAGAMSALAASPREMDRATAELMGRRAG